MKFNRCFILFNLVFYSSFSAAIASSDIKEDNIVKYILLAYEWVRISTNLYIVLAIILTPILLLYFAFLTEGMKSQCPNCKKNHALILINSELISQREAFKTVSRADHISINNSSRDGSGFSDSSGTIHRTEQVRVLEQAHKLTYKCSYCQVLSFNNKITETENFYKSS